MASQLVDAHIAAKERLRDLIVTAVTAAWHGLPHYNQAQMEQWLQTVIPLTAAANRQSVALTQAFLARALGRQPVNIDTGQVLAGIRNGTTPEQVYQRPFIQVWSELGRGVPWTQAVQHGLERATTAAATDVQLSFTHTLQAVGAADSGIVGYERIPDGMACDFCVAASGQIYRTGDLMPLHSSCVTADTLVSVPTPTRDHAASADLVDIVAVTRRRYEGEIVGIQTAAGNELTVTPNHPILTDRGWVAAGLLREGDGVVRSLRSDGERGRVPDEKDMPTRIEDLFRAGLMRGLVGVPFAAEDFHGDAGDGEVDVVLANRGLDISLAPAVLQPVIQEMLSARLRSTSGLGPGATRGGRGALGPAAFRRMRCCRSCASLLRSVASRGDATLLGVGALHDASLGELSIDDVTRDAVLFSDGKDGIAAEIGVHDARKVDTARARLNATRTQRSPEWRLADVSNGRRLRDRLAGEIELDRVVHLRGVSGSHQVFNLVTREGWYAANGIVTHNCMCGVAPVTGDRSFRAAPSRFPAAGGTQVAVRDHGELGPVLTNAADSFTSEADLSASH